MSKKGQQWERETAKRLSEWWSRIGDDDLFWRTHASGARATSRKKVGKKTRGQVGDICATDSRGAKLIKCCPISLKRGYMRVSIQDVLDIESRAKTKEFEEWVKECVVHQLDADSVGWFLLFRRDRRRTLIFMPVDFVWRFPYKIRHKLLTKHPNCMFSMRAGKLLTLKTDDNKAEKRARKKARKKAKKGAKLYWNWWLRNNCVAFGILLDDFLNLVTRDMIVDIYNEEMENRSG